MRTLIIIILFTLGWSVPLMAQQHPPPIPPGDTREADVMFSKRTWRVIDLRERQNKIATWPRNPVTKILYNAVLNHQLKAYKTDSLLASFDIEEFVQRGSTKTLVRKLVDINDPDGLYTTDTVYEPFNPEERITQLILMEEWFFDKRAGKEFSRIIAIAPLFKWQVDGYDLGMQPLCWLKYHDRKETETDCRDILSKQVMFNAENSYSKFTYDDWFEQRRFGSFIIKTSNVYDISIMDDPDVKKNGLEALIEAERLKQEQYERGTNQFED